MKSQEKEKWSDKVLMSNLDGFVRLVVSYLCGRKEEIEREKEREP